MPTNGPSELSMSSLYGIPLFTYGMIGVTTIILAYVTFMDDSEGNSFANPDDQSIEEPVIVPTEEPVIEEVIEEPVIEEPVIEEPVIEEPVIEENIAPVEEEKVVPTEIKGGKKSKKNKTKRKSNRNIL